MAIQIRQREAFDSIDEKIFYTQLLRTLTPFHKLEEYSLQKHVETVEELIYGEFAKDMRHAGDDPPDSLSAA